MQWGETTTELWRHNVRSDDVRHDLIDEILTGHAGGWLREGARAAATRGEAEGVLRYHLVGTLGGRFDRRWQGERDGVVFPGESDGGTGGDQGVVLSWRELAEVARSGQPG